MRISNVVLSGLTNQLEPIRHTYYHINGKVAKYVYCLNSKIHRVGAPAVICYDEQGDKIEECYFYNDSLHRENAPAKTLYNENETLAAEYYYCNGKTHRLDGPAKLFYDIEGKNPIGQYYINGEFIEHIKTDKQWFKYLDQRKMLEYFS